MIKEGCANLEHGEVVVDYERQNAGGCDEKLNAEGVVVPIVRG